MGESNPVHESLDEYATELERATRGLLDVNVMALGRMEDKASPAHLRALQALDRRGASHVSELAETLDVPPSTASRLSDRLTAQGLITREVSPANRRATLLELTPTGKEVLEEFFAARRAALLEVVSRLDDDERGALLRGTSAFTTARRRDETTTDASARTA